MMLADTLEALGLKRGQYIVKLNSRKLLDGVLEAAGVAVSDRARRGVVLRAVDKLRSRVPEVRLFFLGLKHPKIKLRSGPPPP